MSSTPSTWPKIAIIGGGPAGLVTLLTLHSRGVNATLYEREPSSSSRAHMGGMLDLTWDEGQRALRENGLAEVFITCTIEWRLTSKTASKVISHNGIAVSRIGRYLPTRGPLEGCFKRQTQTANLLFRWYYGVSTL